MKPLRMCKVRLLPLHIHDIIIHDLAKMINTGPRLINYTKDTINTLLNVPKTIIKLLTLYIYFNNI